MKKDTLFLSLICLLALILSPVDAKVPDHVLKQKKAVVTILVSGKDSKVLGTGTGFIINENGSIATNYHVIAPLLEDKDNSLIVKMENGAFFLLEDILSYDKGNDVAIIKVMGKGLPFLKLSHGDIMPKQGEDVFVIGSPQGLDTTVSDGIVSSIRGHKGFIQITAPISPGNSGSPVFNVKGEAIGVATFYLEGGQNLNFAVPIKNVLDLLNQPKDSKQKSETPAPTKEPNLYKNESYGLSITFPDGWILKREPLPRVLVLADGGNDQEITLAALDLPKGFESLDFGKVTDDMRKRVGEKALETYKKLGYEDVELLEHGATEIQNIKAIWGKANYTKKQPFKEIKMKALKFIMAENGKEFHISCYAPRERFGAFEKTCLQVTESFMIKRELVKAKPAMEKTSGRITSANGKKGPYAIRYDETKWSQCEKQLSPDADLCFRHVSNYVYALSSFSRVRVPKENLTNALFNVQKTKNPEASKVSEGRIIVNGKEVMFLQWNAEPMGIPASYLGYYYPGEKGLYEVVTWVSQNLFEEYRSDIEDFLKGLTISE